MVAVAVVGLVCWVLGYLELVVAVVLEGVAEMDGTASTVPAVGPLLMVAVGPRPVDAAGLSVGVAVADTDDLSVFPTHRGLGVQKDQQPKRECFGRMPAGPRADTVVPVERRRLPLHR